MYLLYIGLLFTSMYRALNVEKTDKLLNMDLITPIPSDIS